MNSSARTLSGRRLAAPGGNPGQRFSRCSNAHRVQLGTLVVLALALLAGALHLDAAEPGSQAAAWPQEYSVKRDKRAGFLTLSTPYYTVQHDLKRGGAIAVIRLVYGKAANLLVKPMATCLQDDTGAVFTDLNDARARVSHRKDGQCDVVTVEGRLRDDRGRRLDVRVKTVFEYHWGYIRVRKEFTAPEGSVRVRAVCPFSAVLAPSLSDYGYREGVTEQEGAPAFSFGSGVWGKLRLENAADRALRMALVPRWMMFADPGAEGLEWFASSDLSQWELQLTGRRGQGQCVLERSQEPPGLAVSIAPYFSTNAAVTLPKRCAFHFNIGIPVLEGHARRPWMHSTFNRNRGNWVSPDEIRRWAERGIQTVHCHNDGDYYNDGLFWRDGAYPPYPDMDNFNRVIAGCHQAGIRVATYFSNKELHPDTPEFRDHGSEWGRMNRRGQLQHNFYSGTNEFGAQMCLRSGWLDYLKQSIDRVLKHHPLDGVYYDWNVALYCCNGLHEGRKAGEAAVGHWDIDELLDLMEWTRRRVGPDGLAIIHNTTTPMFATENFASHVVANEWGYGAWKDQGPTLAELPLEWSLVGARSRGVISYGQLNDKSPKRLYRLFALEALLSGVTPWPPGAEALEVFSLLKPLGDIERYRFADWRNRAVSLDDSGCASAIYSGPQASYIVLANLKPDAREVRCVVHPERLAYPLPSPVTATLLRGENADGLSLDVHQLSGAGVKVMVPGDSAVLLQIR